MKRSATPASFAIEHLQIAERDDAAKDLRAARARRPNDPVVQLGSAFYDLRTGRDADVPSPPAAGAIEDLLLLDSIGLAQSHLGLHLDAYRYFGRARSLDRRRISSLVGHGLAAVRLGRYREAKEAFRALKAFMNESEAFPRLVLIYTAFHQSRTASPEFLRQLIRESRQLVRELEEHTGRNAFSLLASGAIDGMTPLKTRKPTDRTPGAAISQAVEEAGGLEKLPALFHEMAATLLMLDAPEQAREHALAALKMKPESALAPSALALIAWNEGDDRTALDQIRTARDRAPHALIPLLTVIKIARRKVRNTSPFTPGEVVDVAMRLIEIGPDDPTLLIDAAEALIKYEEHASAREALRLALERTVIDERPDIAERARSLLESL